MAHVFDGPNLTIILHAGGSVHTVEWFEVFSRWKEWLKTAGHQYEPAFDVIGGDPLTAALNAGSYFFLRNDLGWRVRPAEEDATISVVGQLVGKDTALSLMVPTVGNFTVFVNGLQPITQSAAPILEKVEEIHGQTQREVWIDPQFPTNGNFGYQHLPFNTWTDGVDYAEANNIITLALKDDATVDRLLKNFEIRGIAFPNLDMNGQNLDKTTIRRMNVTGNNLGQPILEDCAITNVLSGEMIGQRVGISGTLGLRDGGSTLLSEVDVFTPGSPFTVDFLTGAAGSSLSLTRVSGDLTIINMNHADDDCHIHMSHGTVTIAASCTAGNIVLMGEANLIDNSAGTVVDKDALIEPDDVRKTRKRLLNREYINPVTNKIEQQNDGDTGIESSADIWEDDGVTPWDGTGPIRRRDRMV